VHNVTLNRHKGENLPVQCWAETGNFTNQTKFDLESYWMFFVLFCHHNKKYGYTLYSSFFATCFGSLSHHQVTWLGCSNKINYKLTYFFLRCIKYGGSKRGQRNVITSLNWQKIVDRNKNKQHLTWGSVWNGLHSGCTCCMSHYWSGRAENNFSMPLML
jgi:hypothetical protein